ncbi:hypothetical protein [Pseudomonas sp. NPDC089547]|uniref:hypothetical protein n=1 Tax=Pseudomonas sp. NPDC089547 TaxID=3390652 RepID=UPI003CFD65C6
MSIRILLAMLCGCVPLQAVNATPIGSVKYADLASINGMPALCLPKSETAPFAVGWATLYDSYAKDVDAWQVVLKEQAAPVVLKPGECFAYGTVPEGYMLEKGTAGKKPLQLEVGKTYAFRLNSASRSVDAYFVVFCITSEGEGRFVKYPPLSSGEAVPSCDGRNGNRISR